MLYTHVIYSLERNYYEIHQYYLFKLMVKEKATWKLTKY
jgi:hypothetical protein